MPDPGERIWMYRDDLDGIPQFEIADGYALRWYQPGDEQHWLAIHHVADTLNTFTDQSFGKQFHHDTEALKQRQCYLLDARDKPVGTATAWYDDFNVGEGFGCVHWVAILPDAQGKGLSKPLLACILSRMRDMGHWRAYLATSTARPAAVHLYEKFGFQRRPAPPGVA